MGMHEPADNSNVSNVPLPPPPPPIANNEHLLAKYMIAKDGTLITSRRKTSKKSTQNANNNNHTSRATTTPTDTNNNSNDNIINETREMTPPTTPPTTSKSELLAHLSTMNELIRESDTIVLVVRLTSFIGEQQRYLLIVDRQSNPSSGDGSQSLESLLLGIDFYKSSGETRCSVGIVLPIYANCATSLDGDGILKFISAQLSAHVFKPMSIQAMWSAYQYLQKRFDNARSRNCFLPNTTQPQPQPQQQQQQTQANEEASAASNDWLAYYESLIAKTKPLGNSGGEQQQASGSGGGSSSSSPVLATVFVNEWHQKEERSEQREDEMTPYFKCLQLPKDQEEMGMRIREKVREIEQANKETFDSMNPVHISRMLERLLAANLDAYKKFIDATIIQFYGQKVVAVSPILAGLYLGSEWNASDYDTLVANRISHVLNVSTEVDNFFPDHFAYHNVPVQDVESVDLVKEFAKTHAFIRRARDSGGACLVHCKMGVSRSATIVLAYLMKELDWSYATALDFVKAKRARVRPNDAFRQQLLMYESMLNGLRRTSKLFNSAASSSSSSSSDSSKSRGPSNRGGGGGEGGAVLMRSNSLKQLMLGETARTSGNSVNWSRQQRSWENTSTATTAASSSTSSSTKVTMRTPTTTATTTTTTTPTQMQVKRAVSQMSPKKSQDLVSFSLHDATNTATAADDTNKSAAAITTPKMADNCNGGGGGGGGASGGLAVISRQHGSWSSSSSSTVSATANIFRKQGAPLSASAAAAAAASSKSHSVGNRTSMPVSVTTTSTTTPTTTLGSACPHRASSYQPSSQQQQQVVSLIGNVKQQVESINGQSRPCLIGDDDDNDNDNEATRPDDFSNDPPVNATDDDDNADARVTPQHSKCEKTGLSRSAR